jgi:hypothetical protein
MAFGVLLYYYKVNSFSCIWTSSFTQFHYLNTQGVSRIVDITAGGDLLGLCDKKISYEHVSDFGLLRIYGHF